jgi:hypothetical protein
MRRAIYQGHHTLGFEGHSSIRSPTSSST